MDKKTYIDKRNKIFYINEQYYNNNTEERGKYEYRSVHGHKYVEKRSYDNEHKTKQNEYYRKYRERHKYISQDNSHH